MLYESTRGGSKGISSAQAIKNGLAPDGGLYVPDSDVFFSLEKLYELSLMDYRERAVEVLKEYLTDFDIEELVQCVNSAYDTKNYSSPKIAPLKKLNKYISVLELWHGPTCAFKDMALQILPHLLVKSTQKTGDDNEVVILVATSGDTGKAALEGFKDVPHTRVIVFFPEDGVSEVQRLQMITQEGNNLDSIAVHGNFDDAQTGVKNIFNNKDFNRNLLEKGYSLSSANSINWGRLAPQIVYYFSAYADLLRTSEITNGDKINFVVPTGNFGNILAAYYAKKMGLPINMLICASNENNVLTDFIRTGEYNKNREFYKTNSPSMDILISSNLERLLYDISDKDSESINKWMNELNQKGVYKVDSKTLDKISSHFWSSSSNSNEAIDTIKSIYEYYDYVCDTHTAIALNVYDKYVIATGDLTKTIIVSTASPYKFNKSVSSAILGEDILKDKDEFQLLEILSSKTNLPIPSSLDKLDKKIILHNKSTNKNEMENIVTSILFK